MTRPLTIPENQMRAIIRAARKEGARIEVKMGKAVVTVIPDDLPQGKKPVDNLPKAGGNSLKAWRERHGSKTDGHP